jgi:hypothetical protein
MTGPTRPRGMARMLLRSAGICLISAMSACVLPIAPEFQDPPASPNFSPQILSASPDIGSIVTAPSPTTIPTFIVTVTDPNFGDTLHVRWLADYPPSTANTRTLTRDQTFPPNSNGGAVNGSSMVIPNCNADNLARIPQHQIMMVVGDRMFDDSPPPQGMLPDLTKLQGTDGLKAIATWVLNLECP